MRDLADTTAAPEGPAAAVPETLIGPNAVLQMIAPLQARLGREAAASLLCRAGLSELPDGSAMIPEAQAACLHQRLRTECPETAQAILREAGLGTGAYILAHRIPPPAQAVLRLLPARLAARVLARAIARHAWTFAGSGRFRIVPRAEWASAPSLHAAAAPRCVAAMSPRPSGPRPDGQGRPARAPVLVFEIADNPVVRGEQAETPICHWHVAVFEALFRSLVSPGAQVRETACCAAGALACRFEITLS